MHYKVVLRQGEDGYIVAECPSIPGCISQGRSRDEAIANLREAIELCLDCYREDGVQPPADSTELLEIAV